MLTANNTYYVCFVCDGYIHRISNATFHTERIQYNEEIEGKSTQKYCGKAGKWEFKSFMEMKINVKFKEMPASWHNHWTHAVWSSLFFPLFIL